MKYNIIKEPFNSWSHHLSPYSITEYKKNPQHMTLEIQILAWKMQKIWRGSTGKWKKNPNNIH
jgi:hypothetical protein